ncbi:hypothetical protein QE152_g29463 [Popillia japonica]|uniref:Uncharacterized protein n=1 Tax=Popillia japonica TaxID=7064 RepID=A0AAW1JH70_POPJA
MLRESKFVENLLTFARCNTFANGEGDNDSKREKRQCSEFRSVRRKTTTKSHRHCQTAQLKETTVRSEITSQEAVVKMAQFPLKIALRLLIGFEE